MSPNSTGNRVIVCGGRGWGENKLPPTDPGHADRAIVAQAERDRLFQVLDEISVGWGAFAFVMAGGAEGADRHAIAWAKARSIQFQIAYANWQKFGKKARPIRNTQMLAQGRPHFVIAAPGNAGTADMTGKALAAGVPVIAFTMTTMTVTTPEKPEPAADH